MEKIKCIRRENVVLESMQKIVKNISSDLIYDVDVINMFFEKIICTDEGLENHTDNQVYESLDQYIVGVYEILSFLVSE
jgi:hypothetical protein